MIEDQDILQIWQAQNIKPEQVAAFNQKLLTEMAGLKAEGALNKLQRFTTRGIITAIIYLSLLAAVLLYAICNAKAGADYFTLSMGGIFLINLKALADYIKHYTRASRIDFSGSVLTVQRDLARLELSFFSHVRIMVLQLPFWTTFFLSSSWFPAKAPQILVVLQLMVTGASVVTSLWLFKKLRPENLDKKWVRKLVNGAGAGWVTQAMGFYKETLGFTQE